MNCFGKRALQEVLTPVSGEKFIFPVADGTVNFSGGDQVLRTYTLIRDRPDRGEEQENLLGESDGLSSTPFHDSSLDAGEARFGFWSMSGNFIYRHHVEPRVTVRAARNVIPNSTEIDRRDQGYKFIV